MFSIDEPHYHFSAITQPMVHFYVISSIFDLYVIQDINNFIFEILTFNRMGNTLYYYINPSTILISVTCFNIVIY